jgi:hypothetical protein
LTALTEDTAPTTDDLLYTVTDPAGTPASRKATIANTLSLSGGGYELGRTTLGSAGDTITVSGFTARKYLTIVISLLPKTSTINVLLQFNNDTAANYSRRVSDNGAADTTGTGVTSIGLTDAVAQQEMFAICEVVNIATMEKLVTHRLNRRGTAGSGSAPARREGVSKWVNTTDQITRVDVTNDSAGDFEIGSQVIVYGHD